MLDAPQQKEVEVVPKLIRTTLHMVCRLSLDGLHCVRVLSRDETRTWVSVCLFL